MCDDETVCFILAPVINYQQFELTRKAASSLLFAKASNHSCLYLNIAVCIYT